MNLWIAITNWIVIVGAVVLLTVIVANWLATYRTPRAAPAGSSSWFALPAWAQIGAG